MLTRSFAEKSSYHKMQMLGKTSANRIPLKKPKMKEGFISKAEVDRLNAKKVEATPARPTKNFFNPLRTDVSPNHIDGRVTNTMTYSDTLYNQTSSGIAGRKTDMSDLGTVFGSELRNFDLGQGNATRGTRKSPHELAPHRRLVRLRSSRLQVHAGADS